MEKDTILLQILDNEITRADMYEYGYTYAKMLPLTMKKAIEFWEKGLQVYILYEDNTEAAINCLDEIMEYGEKGTIFGMEKDTWNLHIFKDEKKR